VWVEFLESLSLHYETFYCTLNAKYLRNNQKNTSSLKKNSPGCHRNCLTVCKPQNTRIENQCQNATIYNQLHQRQKFSSNSWKYFLNKNEQCTLLRIHQMMILPTLRYGDAAYRSASPITRKTLEPVHHKRVRLALGNYCSMPDRKCFMNLLYEQLNTCVNYK
jgi:hypothetical protein